MKIKVLISFVILSIFTFISLNFIPANANNIYVGNATSDVYTLSKTEFDRETNDVVYQKVSYSSRTYSSTICNELDASGASIDVSEDAQYVFFPARYYDMTDSTKVSFKYKNSGVEKIVVHAEYAAGISSGGVDYKGGCKIICMNALDPSVSWNVSYSKSIDGYDVVSILFGSYALEIYDMLLTGFRLYFDYGVEKITETREFEIFGYEVHESDEVPSFASDPKPTRISKLTSNDVEIVNNKFTVADEATVSADIYDYTSDCYKLQINMTLSDIANVEIKLDDNVFVNKTYLKGSHNIQLELTEDEYLTLKMKFIGNDVIVKIDSVEFLSTPYADSLGGSGYEVVETEQGQEVTYEYLTGWYSCDSAIRNYNKDYQYLEINFEVVTPMVIGIYIDEVSVRSHYEYSTPVAAGTYSFLYDLSEIDIDSSSMIKFYLDAPVTGNNGTEGTKKIIINSMNFKSLSDFPQTIITVEEKYEHSYDGLSHGINPSSNNGTSLTVEYKLDGAPDDQYTVEAPIAVGTYVARITAPTVMVGDEIVFAKTVVYSIIEIKKATVEAPTISDINIDYTNNIIEYNEYIYLVSTTADYTNVVKTGSYITYGTTLYVKYIESDYFFESDTTIIELNQKGEDFSTSINIALESSTDVIPANVEYSVDGINWISGNNTTIHLEGNNIYLFRTKATSSAFAGNVYYLPVAPRPALTQKIEVETGLYDVVVKQVENAEYRINDGEWQDSNVFDGLTTSEIVKISMRIKGSDTSYASEEVSVYVMVFVGVVEAPQENQEQETPDIDDEIIQDEELILGEHEYIVTNYSELYNALSKTSNNYETVIYVNGSISLQYNIDINGKVKFVGLENAEIVFEYNNSKRTINNTKNSIIKFENILIKRTVVNSTEGFLFRLEKNGEIYFTETTFDVAVMESGADVSYDRITYVPNGVDMKLYFNNCTYNTEGYFYRGTMVFFNDDVIPTTAGSPTIHDLNNLKIDYTNKKIIFPASVKVSLDENFTELVKTGSALESNATYYVAKEELVFTVQTKAFKYATPTLESVDVDFAKEVINFSAAYQVSKNAEFTELVTSGDKVTPGMKLYIKQLGDENFEESDVFEVTLPTVGEAVKLDKAFVCDFGFVMEYYPNVEFQINGGEWQDSLVFVGLEENTKYTVTMRIAASDNSFASNTYQIEVTTTN